MWFPKKKITAVMEGHSNDYDYTNLAGQKAMLSTIHYSDKSVPPDHYVHIPGHRSTVHSTVDKAVKKLKSLGFSPVKDKSGTTSSHWPNPMKEDQ